MLNKVQRFILVCVVAVAILAGCERPAPECHVVEFQDSGWEYGRNVWRDSSGDLVGTAQTEDSTIYHCW